MFLKRTEHLPVRIEERPTATAVVDFDSFVDGVTLRLPLGVMREVRRLVDTLRPEWRKLQGQATRVAELESRLRAAEAHRCEDPDEALREENTRLRGIIEQQSRRLEAFERLNHHRPITEEHLVVSSRD
ncbi:MAG: hypothetical protein HY294_06600 [Candidatus Rokubacteria bacterium]|nr:hypothetical protein [Candidatus Rokubacteria bacterium]